MRFDLAKITLLGFSMHTIKHINGLVYFTLFFSF